MPQGRRDSDDRRPDAIDELRERAERAERERDRLRQENERLQNERERLRRDVERLKRQLDEARRAAHRQAAPFGKSLMRHPRRPGRKPGALYGPKAHRRRPRRIDERHEAPLPGACPDCGGRVSRTRVATQYHEDLPVPQVVVRQFTIQIGQCRACGRRVQGRHPLQTSDALGAASVQLGAHAIAFAVVLNKQTVADAHRFAAHLAVEWPALFTFLFDPTLIDATNWRAEQALRPAVVTRKVCGGNRSRHGADTQQILASVLRTAHQRHLDPHAVVVSLLHARTPTVPVELRNPAQ